MKTITTVRLDLSGPNYGAIVGAIQNDANTRTMQALLLDNGKPWSVPEGVSVAIAYSKIDGTKGWYDVLADGSPAVMIRGSTVTVILASQMLTVPGKIRCAIVFTDAKLNQLTTFPFTVAVESNPFVGAEKSEDYIRIQWLEDKLDEYLTIAKESGIFDGTDGQSPVLLADSIAYQAGQSGEVPPDGLWQETIPSVPKGSYLWTRRVKQWSDSEPTTDYSVSYMGLDGAGSVCSVCGVSPNPDGNVPLSAENTGAISKSGGTMQGTLNMNGHPLTGLRDPVANTDAAKKSYVDKMVREAAPINLLDNSDFRNPVAQAGVGGKHGNQAYAVDRWILSSGSVSHQNNAGLTLNGSIKQKLEFPPTGTVSAFVGVASGSADISYSDGSVTITSNGGIIQWAAVYEGNYSQDTMPIPHPKAYSEELQNCQRFYCRLNFPKSATIGLCYLLSTWLTCTLALPTEMRVTTPQVKQTGNISLAGISETFNQSQPTYTNTSGTNANIGYSATAVTPGAGYYFASDASGAIFELIADL